MVESHVFMGEVALDYHLLIFLNLFGDSILYYVAQARLELTSLLFPFPEFWDDGHRPPHPTVARLWRLGDMGGVITVHCSGLRSIYFDVFLCAKSYLAVVPL